MMELFSRITAAGHDFSIENIQTTMQYIGSRFKASGF
jgi:hypothetical protein